MKILIKPIENQDGFILVLGMAMLVVLTMIGVFATRSSVVDLKIAGNDRKIAQKFYVADTTWRIGGLWLNDKATAPEIVNLTPKGSDTKVDITKEYYAVVRNYGDGGDGVLNDSFAAGTEDGSFVDTPFWYRVIYNGDKNASKFGEGYRDFRMSIQNSADGTTAVATRMHKVYKVGY